MGTDFLLGGALAFLLALLGWSDQIRGVQEKTRTQEKEFLDTYKIRWRDLRSVVRPSEEKTPQDRLLGVLSLFKQGAIMDGEDVHILKHFEVLDGIRRLLESTYSWRYWLIFVTSLYMLICGALSISLQGIMAFGWLTWELLYSIPTMTLLVVVLMLTMKATINESRFRKELNEVEDVLRTAKERRSKTGG